MQESATQYLDWSWWRRQHQAQAAKHHARRRARRAVVETAVAAPVPPIVRERPSYASTLATLWERLVPLLPRPRGRQPKVGRRVVLDAILYVLQTDCGWVNLPSAFPSWQLVHAQYQRWCRAGIWDRIWEGLTLPQPRPMGDLQL
jgi:Putative transposase of IS4/5 family (DUF4096)